MPAAASADDVERERLRRLAWALDSAVRLPGTSRRFGLDGVIGLVPGVGDVAGLALSSVILVQAARLGIPPSVAARMVLNVAVESVVGLVPVLGNVFDFGWKANRRNLRLLEAHLDDPEAARASSRRALAVVAVVVVVLLALLVAGASYLLARLL